VKNSKTGTINVQIIRNDTKFKFLRSILQEKVFGGRGPAKLFRAAVNKMITARLFANIRDE
jgi:hypothetical protein